ncbi:MAG TPA: PEP-CTERM sorting domain-containing protein [Bryobacteraceae bacterium]|nr:PEP-CTERM sorting domain-containing protein [Bryobacteraceae bacterium]
MSKINLLALVVLLLSRSASAAVIDFDDLEPFLPVPFDVAAEDDVIVTFASSQEGTFAVAPIGSVFATLTNNALVDNDPDLHELEITFSRPITRIDLLFALNTADVSNQLSLNALLGQNIVGSASATGTVPDGFSFPEGRLTFTAGAFDTVQLSSTAFDFGIDNVTFSVQAVPEPSSLILISTAFAGGAVMLRRRRMV